MLTKGLVIKCLLLAMTVMLNERFVFYMRKFY